MPCDAGDFTMLNILILLVCIAAIFAGCYYAIRTFLGGSEAQSPDHSKKSPRN